MGAYVQSVCGFILALSRATLTNQRGTCADWRDILAATWADQGSRNLTKGALGEYLGMTVMSRPKRTHYKDMD